MGLVDKVNPKLKKYVEEKVFPMYKLNGESHGIEHIKQVIQRTFEIVEEYERDNPDKEKLNYDILYVVAAYHDIGDHINRRKHHIVSANIMFEDENLDEFFSIKEKQIAKDAIEDHRASNSKDPRTIYGKVILTADRNNSLEDFFKRRIKYCLEHHPEYTENQVLEELYASSKEKFGEKGYAFKKSSYLPSKKLEEYLIQINTLLKKKKEFQEMASLYYHEYIDADVSNNKLKALSEDLEISSNDKTFKE